MTFTGCYTALITPFRDGKVDYDSLAKIIEDQLDGFVDGIVTVGTTGESPTLTMAEHAEVIRFTVKAVDGRCKVIAGTGGNSTPEALELTAQAHKDGADATLQVAPYYNKPNQEGLYQHFKAIAECAPMPVILYNVPGRSSVSIDVETVARLAKVPNIVAIKEASGDVGRVSATLHACDITVLSGDDALTLPMMSTGAEGVISVISNAMPSEMTQLVHMTLAGDFTGARIVHDKLFPLMNDMFIESNPIPVKELMAHMGKCSNEFRLPMTNIAPANMKKLLASAKAAGCENL